MSPAAIKDRTIPTKTPKVEKNTILVGAIGSSRDRKPRLTNATRKPQCTHPPWLASLGFAPSDTFDSGVIYRAMVIAVQSIQSWRTA